MIDLASILSLLGRPSANILVALVSISGSSLLIIDVIAVLSEGRCTLLALLIVPFHWDLSVDKRLLDKTCV